MKLTGSRKSLSLLNQILLAFQLLGAFAYIAIGAYTAIYYLIPIGIITVPLGLLIFYAIDVFVEHTERAVQRN